MLFFVAWFFAWFGSHTLLFNEPDFASYYHSPEQVHAAYLHQKTISAHPVYETFFTCQNAAPYMNSTDVITADLYPFYDLSPTGYDLRQWDREVVRCVALAKAYGKPAPIMIGQAFGHMWDGDYMQWRCPTAYEHRRMIADALKLGAGGVLFWRPVDPKYWCAS
jgi:hypothetical protein